MPLSSYLDRQENQDPRISNDTRQQATKTLRNSKTGLPVTLGGHSLIISSPMLSPVNGNGGISQYPEPSLGSRTSLTI